MIDSKTKFIFKSGLEEVSGPKTQSSTFDSGKSIFWWGCTSMAGLPILFSLLYYLPFLLGPLASTIISHNGLRCRVGLSWKKCLETWWITVYCLFAYRLHLCKMISSLHFRQLILWENYKDETSLIHKGIKLL